MSVNFADFPPAVIERLAGGAAKTLGISYDVMRKDELVASMLITEAHLQPFGILHGGVSVLLAESVASVGGYLNVDPAQSGIVGLEINANHLAPGMLGDTLVARGRPVHVGRKNQVWEILITSKATDKLVCISRCTIAVVALTELESKKGKGQARVVEVNNNNGDNGGVKIPAKL